MKIKSVVTACLTGLILTGCAGLNADDRVFIFAGTAYFDGHKIPEEQYEQAKANGTLDQLFQELKAKDRKSVVDIAQPATVPVQAPPFAASTSSAPTMAASLHSHAAICDTAKAYQASPGENDLFNCNAGLGQMTRAQLVAQGWKIDMMEKMPVTADQSSSHDRPLYTYKLILSR